MKNLKSEIGNFAINLSIFLLLLKLNYGTSGGDMSLIIFYTFLTILQLIIIFFLKKAGFVGISIAVIISILSLYFINKQLEKKPNKATFEEIK